MLLRFKRDKQKGIIPAVLAVIIALASIVLILLIGALIFWIHHLVAGLIGGGNQPGGFYGAGNCATTQTLGGATIPDGGKGKLVLEQHLATVGESFSGGWPSSSHDQDERHYQITNFSVNCAGCPKEGFTPSEGNPPGSVGQGTGEKPPVNAEPWIMNMRANFPRGTKIIITSDKTGKTVVAAGGYEYGPSSHEFIGGAQPEVLNALGILNGDRTVTIGFAQDQSIPYGPIVCGGGVSGSGPCGQSLVNIATSQIGVREDPPHSDRVPYNNRNGHAWCNTFVDWVYMKAGFDYFYKSCFEDINCSREYLQKNGILIDVRNGDTSQIRPGDYFWLKNTANSSSWHAGLVESVSGNQIHTIEGNASEQVKRNVQTAGSGNKQIWYVGRLKNCSL
jgi:hypothetical protein